jgi:hypothetical protein
MPQVLKPSIGWPPGGFPFKDARTGKNFEGMSADLDLQVLNVIQHRKANPSFYPSTETSAFEPANIRQQIIDYMCLLRPHLCGGPEIDRTYQAPVPTDKCPKCGSDKAEPVFCRTCGGQKITGWKCVSCGAERSR